MGGSNQLFLFRLLCSQVVKKRYRLPLKHPPPRIVLLTSHPRLAHQPLPTLTIKRRITKLDIIFLQLHIFKLNFLINPFHLRLVLMQWQISQKLELGLRCSFFRIKLTEFMLDLRPQQPLIFFGTFNFGDVILTHNLLVSFGSLPIRPSDLPAVDPALGIDDLVEFILGELDKITTVSTVLRISDEDWSLGSRLGSVVVNWLVPLALLRRDVLGVEGVQIKEEVSLAGEVGHVGGLGGQPAVLGFDLEAFREAFPDAAGLGAGWVGIWGGYLTVGTC